MEKLKENNLAFIDGQNLHIGIMQNNWKIDHNRFRIYLKDKYHISEAYYFFDIQKMKNKIYIIIFRKRDL